MKRKIKKTQLIELGANIRATKTSFISLTMFAVLGFGIFLGFLWTGKGLHASLDRAYDCGRMCDIEVSFPYDITQEDFAQISQLDGVADAEGSYVCYEHIKIGKVRYLTRFISLNERINTPISYEGTLPKRQNEVAVEAGSAEKLGISLGDVVTLIKDDAYNHQILQKMAEQDMGQLELQQTEELTEDEISYFYEQNMIVTAIIVSPSYISTSPLSYGMSAKDHIQVSGIFYAPRSSFRRDVAEGYNQVLLCAENTKGLSTYDTEYKRAAEQFTDRICPILEEIERKNYQKIKDGAALFCSALEEKVTGTEKKITRSADDLFNGDNGISQAGTQSFAAKKQITTQKQEIAGLEEQIAKVKSSIADLQKIIDDYPAELERIRDKHIKTPEEMFPGIPEFSELQARYTQAQLEISMTADKLKQLETQLIEAKKQLSAAEAAYQADEKLFEEEKARQSFNEQESRITADKADIEKLKELSAIFTQVKQSLEDYGVSCISRNNNAAYFYIDLLSSIMKKLKNSLGGLFLVIGLLICYSVVTRLVYDQKMLIGTKKAMGFSDFEVTLPYLIYAGTAVLIGAVLGGTLSFLLVEPAMTSVLSNTFTFESIKDYFSLNDGLLLFGFEFLLIEIVTVFGCYGVLRQSAVTLLNGYDSQTVNVKWYEKFSVFQRLPIFTRTVVNNCFHDRRRFVATVVGVSSCVMLLVSSVTCRNNVLLGEKKQYDNYFLFDQFICFDTSVSTAENEIEQILQELSVPYAKAYRTYGYLSSEEFSEKMTALMVYDDAEAFNKMIRIESDDKKNPYNAQGAWMAYSIKNAYQLQNQHILSLRTLEDDAVAISTAGFYRSYVYNLTMFIDNETFRQAFNRSAEVNIFVIQTAQCDKNLLEERLRQTDGFVQLQNYYQASKKDAEVFSLMANVFVGVYAMMSAVMAFFVLLNLFVTFIEEKKKELIVLMINGFSVKSAKRYIYSDTVFLTIIGIAVGIVGGIFFGQLAISSFESEYVYLIHAVDWIAIVIGVIVTVLLTVIMTKIALRRIPKFKLEDIDRL